MKTIILDKDAFRHYSPKELHPHFKQFDELLESVIGNDPRCKAYVDFPLGIFDSREQFPIIHLVALYRDSTRHLPFRVHQ